MANACGVVNSTLEGLGLHVFERGWLSSNNVLLVGDGPSALIDSGYHSHATQTCELVSHVLGARPLDLLLNTHLHSDHCGGNARLQAAYPGLNTLIPPGLAVAVRDWDTQALTYAPTGQECDRFHFQGLLSPGDTVRLGAFEWEVHGAKGHDPHSVILFQADHGVMLSADALWENGFGVVFPELEGIEAFDEVRETLDIIERLSPRLVIPGHGKMFTDLGAALARARSRLTQFVDSPQKHLRHAQKVLLKFRLLAWQRVSMNELAKWACNTPYLAAHMPHQGAGTDADRQWLENLVRELEQVGALTRAGSEIIDH